MRFLLSLLLISLSATRAADVVPDSVSPDGKWQIVVETTGEQARYRVAKPDGQLLDGSFQSDYWKIANCLVSRVVWRKDSAYFVIEEGASGIHQAFIVAHQTAEGYEDLPFDRNTVMECTQLSWHHGAVRFDGWLPNDCMAVTVSGDLDGSRAPFECRFVLDLKHGFKVLSHRIIEPK
jgi:hypothetical protein